MKLRKAISTTVDDWLKRDREMRRDHWLLASILLLPLMPVIIAVRWSFKEPERNPDYGKTR